MALDSVNEVSEFGGELILFRDRLDAFDLKDCPEEMIADGVSPGEVNLFQIKDPASEFFGRSDNGGRLRPKVDGCVAFGSPDPHLADRFITSTACREIDDAAIPKLDPCLS